MRAPRWSLALGIAAASCRRAPAPTPASPEPVLVVQRTLGSQPMVFHPTLPLLGQIRDGVCDVWDLDERLYRGSIAGATCAGWGAGEPAVLAPAQVRSGTPHAPAGRDDELIFGVSADENWRVSARRGGDHVYLWDGASRAPVRSFAKPSETGPIERVTVGSNKVVAIGSPGSPIVWDLAGGDARFPINFTSDATTIDPRGRYLACVGTSGGRIPPVDVAVVRLADERVLLEASEVPQLDRVRVVWSSDRTIALAVDLAAIPLEPCDDEEIRVELRSPLELPVQVVSIDRGKLKLASIAPDASAVVLALSEMDECSEAVLISREKRRSTRVYRRSGRTFDRRSLPGLAVDAAWSASASHLALAMDDGAIVVLDLTAKSLDPVARWPGIAPVAISPDGARVASIEKGVLTVRASGRSSPLGGDAQALAWSAMRFAVATRDAVTVFDATSLEQKQRFAIPNVSSLVFDPESGVLCAIGHDAALVIDTAGRAQRVDVSNGTTASWFAGWLVLHEPTRVRRLRLVEGTWTSLDERTVDAGEAVNADGTLEIVGDAFRRLADGERLHLTEDGAYTESGAFERSLPKGWILREGGTLTGRLLRAESASFLHPTPDLRSRFFSGEAVPHPHQP